MDKIILSILILKRLTAYEICNIIRQNYSSMCSDSLGSIQVALKKLLAAGKKPLSEYIKNDTEYLLGIQLTSGQTNIDQSLNEILYFQNKTLQFGIDSAKFFCFGAGEKRNMIPVLLY